MNQDDVDPKHIDLNPTKLNYGVTPREVIADRERDNPLGPLTRKLISAVQLGHKVREGVGCLECASCYTTLVHVAGGWSGPLAELICPQANTGKSDVRISGGTLEATLITMSEQGLVQLTWIPAPISEWECKLTTRGMSSAGGGVSPSEAVKHCYDARYNSVGMR